MEFHEAAEIFPLDEDSLVALGDDIRQHGQRESVKTLGGKILDGRRRWLACQRVGVKPRLEAVETDDPVAYSLSLNLHRRQLTPSQASMVGARAKAVYAKRAKERQKVRKGNQPGATPANLPDMHKGDARDQAAKAVGVSGRSIDHATRVIEKGVPELAKAVDEGRMAVSTAAILASEPESQQREAVAEQMRRGRTYKPNVGGGTPGKKPKPEPEERPEGELRGVGIFRAHEAINCLMQIPKHDALRKRGFQVVTDWIRHNQ